jgi:hypothetical protein
MIGMMLVAGLVVAVVVIAKRRAAVGLDVDELGSVSDHWVRHQRRSAVQIRLEPEPTPADHPERRPAKAGHYERTSSSTY